MTSPVPKQQLRWLHLSDFHLKSHEKWSQDVVLRSLLTDISNRISDTKPLDFIFLSGDLAFSGKPEEYLVVEEFLDQLMETTGVSADKVLMVPGNHDINRNIETDAFAGARSILKNGIEVDRFLGDEDRRKTLFRRQSTFREFANRITKQDRYTDTSHYHSAHYNLQGLNVSVLLVDSCWLSEGGATDSHSILVGERQLIDLIQTLSEPTFTIAIMHHPLDWLAPFEHAAVKNLLADHCHLLFRGHVHEDSIETISSSKNQLKVFTAGASYESRLSSNCYGYGTLDLQSGDGKCVIHKYRNDSRTWEKQEPVFWTLTDRQYFPIGFHEVSQFLDPLRPPYPHYLMCLVSHKVMEIPVLLDEQVVFLSCTEQIASITSLARTIIRLRFLINWRKCWDQNTWQVTFQHAVASYSQAMTEFSVNEQTQMLLSQREEHCERIFLVIHRRNSDTYEDNQTVMQALELAAGGARDLSVAVLNRLLTQQEISNQDTASALRALTKIHLMEGNDNQALNAINRLLSFSASNGGDHLLAATCCLNTQDLDQAVQHLETASELGVAFELLTGLAIRAAGETGDANLIARLRDRDDW